MRAGQGPIAPGSSDSVDVYIDTAGKTGSFVKTVTISTNDPRQASVVLQLRANVLSPAPISK